MPVHKASMRTDESKDPIVQKKYILEIDIKCNTILCKILKAKHSVHSLQQKLNFLYETVGKRRIDLIDNLSTVQNNLMAAYNATNPDPSQISELSNNIDILSAALDKSITDAEQKEMEEYSRRIEELNELAQRQQALFTKWQKQKKVYENCLILGLNYDMNNNPISNLRGNIDK